MVLEKIALEDDYFVSRNLSNGRLLSGIVQPRSASRCRCYLHLFARAARWLDCQWQEMIADPEYKNRRPRQLYTGATRREVVPINPA